MRLLIAGLTILLVASPAVAQVVFDAKPTVKVESNQGATSRVLLSEPDRTQYRVAIIRRGGRYFWSSREDRELLHHVSGAFHYFNDPGGGGSSLDGVETFLQSIFDDLKLKSNMSKGFALARRSSRCPGSLLAFPGLRGRRG